eukprot:scaffold73611_cov39-Phaeocystis_antarctica.AAC.1
MPASPARLRRCWRLREEEEALGGQCLDAAVASARRAAHAALRPVAVGRHGLGGLQRPLHGAEGAREDRALAERLLEPLLWALGPAALCSCGWRRARGIVVAGVLLLLLRVV